MATLITRKVEIAKKHLVKENQLFSNNLILPLSEKVVENTNCYDYVLNTLYDNNAYGFNVPGFTTGTRFTSRKDLPEKVCADLENLGIHYRKLKLFDSKDLGDNEYLIKAFYYSPSRSYPKGTFHFIRQNRETGLWYHKPGREEPIAIGYEDPSKIFFIGEIASPHCYFYPVCYFALENV